MNTITGNKIGTKVNILINGTPLSKDFGNDDMARKVFEQILKCKADPSDKNINKLYGFLNENIRRARQGGFEYDLQTGETYLEGFNTPVPNDLLEVVDDYIENGYPIESIINFWKLLMLNPDKRVREDLFKFISTHDFSITDKGYMVVYKTVDYMNKVENDLAEIVTNAYIKIKDSWKKSPANFSVYKEITRNIEEVEEEVVKWEYKVTETSTLSKWIEDAEKEIKVVGVLSELNEKVVEQKDKSVYTDKHTKKMKIELGVPVMMDRKDCDADPKRDCSYGLHVGATKYVEHFRGNGESPVLVCLVNPMNVVAVPEYDHSKMRVTEYYPFAKGTVDKNGKIEIIENKYFESDYANIEETELAKLLRANQDELRPTAKNAEADDRDIEEYLSILESRVIDLSK